MLGIGVYGVFTCNLCSQDFPEVIPPLEQQLPVCPHCTAQAQLRCVLVEYVALARL